VLDDIASDASPGTCIFEITASPFLSWAGERSVQPFEAVRLKESNSTGDSIKLFWAGVVIEYLATK
jgi:hypothetical protein